MFTGLCQRRAIGAAMLHRIALVWLSLVVASVLAVLSQPAQAQISFADAGFFAEPIVALPPYEPVGLTFAADGAMFVWQKSGVVRIVRDGVLLPQPFLDIRSQVNSCLDRGLLGLALDPGFATNGYVYLLYTVESGGDPADCGPKVSHLTRVTADPLNRDVMLAGSEVQILGTFPSESMSHSIGTVRFAPDGKLLLSNGDGADFYAVDALALRSLDLNSYSGKILRINPDGSAPSDNPFYDGTNSVRSRVYAYGLRNPFRFGIHAATGIPYIGDVGWNSFEEINRGRGANFGWPCYEGSGPQSLYQSAFQQCRDLAAASVTPPLYTYGRSIGRTVVGGTFYTGANFPAQYAGNFFFADYDARSIRRMTFDATMAMTGVQNFASNVDTVSIEMGPDAMLYYAELSTGTIGRIRYGTGQAPPVAQAAASPNAGLSPLTVSLSSAGSNDPSGGTLSYLWTFGDGTTSTAANPTHVYTAATPTVFTTTLRVTSSVSGLSSIASVAVTVGGRPPVGTIVTPADGTIVNPGQTIAFSGTATDPDGPLPPTAMAWTVFLHHNDHVHPYLTALGSGGSFEVAAHGIGTFRYELVLTVTDESGLTDTKSISLPMTAVGTPDVIAAYAFSEGTATTTEDATGNGNTGTLVNGVGWTAGRFGSAVSLDGVNDRIGVADAAALDLTSGLTLSAWVWPTATANWRTVLMKERTAAGGGFAYALYSAGWEAGTPPALWLSIGGNEVDATGVAPLPLGAWSHLAGTYDGATLRLYVNGTLVASRAAAGLVDASAGPLQIGSNQTWGEWFVGAIDEVRIYDRALTEAEIQFDRDTPIVAGGATNTPPTISTIADRSTPEDTATGAIAFTVGDGETPAGSLAVSGSSSNTALVPNAAIGFGGSGTNRTVSVTPAPNQSGSATITVTVSDGALTASTSFVLTVNAVNDPPTISAIGAQTTSAGTPVGPIGFTVGDVETAAASLTVSASSSNVGLVPVGNIVFGGSGASRTVTVTPAAGQTGNTTITVTVNDGALTASTGFTLTVTPPRTTLFPVSVAVLSGTYTSGSAASLAADDNIWYQVASTTTGTRLASWYASFLSVPKSLSALVVNYVGSNSANCTQRVSIYNWTTSAWVQLDSRTVGATEVTINNLVPPGLHGDFVSGTGGNGEVRVRIECQATANRTSRGEVTSISFDGAAAPNTPPTISSIGDRVTAEDTATGAIAFTVGDGETPAGSLAVSGSSSNTALVPNAAIGFGGSGTNRTVSVTPAPNQSGSATITVTVSDGALTASTSFVLTVNAVNDPPTISAIGAQTTPASTPVGPIGFTVGDVETAAGGLTVSGASSNVALVPVGNIGFGGSGASRTVTVTPVAGQTGSATITLTVTDGTLTASTSFALTVTAVNTPPTISSIADRSTVEDTATGAIAFTVADGETPAGSLAVSGSSSNTVLVPNAAISFGGSGTNRTVNVTPAANQSGSATITVTVSDGALTASTSFVLTVNAVNDPPTISAIGAQTTAASTPVGPIGFTVGDVETVAGSLTVSASSSNVGLVPVGNIVFGGSGASRTVTVTPVAGQTGSATITVTVNDGTLTASTSFTLTVNTVAIPAGLRAGYALDENAGSTAVDVSGNGNTGTLVNGAGWTAGRYGSAVLFDGVNDRISVAAAAFLDLASGLTLTAWVRPTATANWRTVMMKEKAAAGAGFAYALYSAGWEADTPPALWLSIGGTEVDATGVAPLPLGAWTHLAGTYDGATLRLYVNGALVASRAAAGSIDTSTGPLQIGGNQTWGEWFSGAVDNVRVYGRALSAAEIATESTVP